MAKIFLWAAVTCLAGPTLLQFFLAVADLLLRGENISIRAVYQNLDGGTWLQPFGFIVLVAISVGLTLLEHHNTKKISPGLVSLKTIVGDFSFNSSSVYCYVGDITHISEADVVVTSENTGLDLGSISGTSVSGRVRRLVAGKGPSGEIEVDHLQKYLISYKAKIGKQADFNLGHKIIIDESNYSKMNNIHAIILAVAIRKDQKGSSHIEESAIYNIINDSLSLAQDRNYSSIFFPIFGLGSGGIAPNEAIAATVSSLSAILRSKKIKFRVYLGVYRDDHLAELYLQLRTESLNKCLPAT